MINTSLDAGHCQCSLCRSEKCPFLLSKLFSIGAAANVCQDAFPVQLVLRWAPMMWWPQCLDWPRVSTTSEYFLENHNAGESLHLTHFLVTRKAKEAMQARFGSVWESVGVFKTPTHANNVPDLMLIASSRRGGLAGRSSTQERTLRRRLRREQDEERTENAEREEVESDDDDVGPLLGLLDIE